MKGVMFIPKEGHCRCGRRQHTMDDLQRWRSEFPDGKPAADPEWAKEICWASDYDDCFRHPQKRGAGT